MTSRSLLQGPFCRTCRLLGRERSQFPSVTLVLELSPFLTVTAAHAQSGEVDWALASSGDTIIWEPGPACGNTSLERGRPQALQLRRCYTGRVEYCSLFIVAHSTFREACKAPSPRFFFILSLWNQKKQRRVICRIKCHDVPLWAEASFSPSLALLHCVGWSLPVTIATLRRPCPVHLPGKTDRTTCQRLFWMI